MKLKYYLRGLGIGIICTAIIMGIALSGNKKETLTDAEIIERARLLGMVMEEDIEGAEDAESSEVQDPINENKDTTEKKLEDSKLNNSTEGIKTAGDKKEDKPLENDKESSEDKPSEENKSEGDKQDETGKTAQSETKDDSQELIKVEINTGEYSDVISRKLFEAGLVADSEAFNRYLTQKGADDSLRVGVYQIPKGATQDEIIQILQGKSN